MIKILILILSFLFISFGKAGEIIFEGTGKADIMAQLIHVMIIGILQDHAIYTSTKAMA